MNEKEKDMSIEDILDILRNNKLIIILTAIVVATLIFAKTSFYDKDTFSATGILYISNRTQDRSEQVIEKGDIDTSRSLSTTYIELLKTDSFLEAVSKQLTFDCSWQKISSMLSVSVVGETELVKISVTSDKKTEAYNVSKEILKQAPTMLTDIFEGGDVRVVNPPRFPSAPNNKGTGKKTVIGFFIGAFLGCIYAFIKFFSDKKVHKGEDVSKRYNIPLLGEPSQVENNLKHFKKRKNDSKSTDKIINKDTDFNTVETYKAIRTNIMFSAPKQDLAKVIAITSAAPGEGKTTTAINLAITFAQTGAKILLIDCDLRRARVHRYLQIEKKSGVSNVVCGYSKAENSIQKNIRENLDCLPAGEIPPNPAELLQTDAFHNMLSELKKDYDYIFIDTPPITVVTDAAIISKESSGLIIVTRSEMTTYDLLDAAVNEIRNTNGQIMGSIVLDSNSKQKKYGYYKSKKEGKYAYKYAYRYEDDKEK